MNPLLQLLPFLALIAFQSIEVTAQALGSKKYPPLAGAGQINGFDLTWNIKSKATGEYTISTVSGGGCTLAQAASDSCTIPRIQWEEDDVPTIDIFASVPAPTDLKVFGGTPSKIIAYLCFSPPSAKNKKWRKINDLFKKDNSCKLSTVLQDTDPVDYPNASNSALSLGTLKVPSKVPTAFFTIRAAVLCADGDTISAKNEFCHVVNRQPSLAATGAAADVNEAVYFHTTVMDSRPTRLYVAVFICAFIGPVIFLAFMIYERGFLAKQA